MYGNKQRLHESIDTRPAARKIYPEKLNSSRTLPAEPKRFAPPVRNMAGAASDVEAFLARNHVDREVAEKLRQLEPHLQREVLLWGDVHQTRSPTQQLLRHIRDVVRGTHSSTTRDNSSNVLRSIWPKLHDGDCRFLLTVGAPKLSRSSGRWYYEAELGRGIEDVHIGWAAREFDGEGCIGRDEYGWAADGMRHLFWHNGPTQVKWQQTWQAGDIIGCAIDIDAEEMIFFHNGKWALPAPFKRPEDGISIFPAVTARGEFVLHFTEATFSYWSNDPSFKPLMNVDEAKAAYGCRGSFNRPGPQDEMPPESPRPKGVRIYKDSPFQNSVVDMVVFGRDMDFSGVKQFNDDFMDMYKDRFGIASTHTDVKNDMGKVAKPGIRHYGAKPEHKSVVREIIEGKEACMNGSTGGNIQWKDEFPEMFEGAAGKPSVQKGSCRDQPPPQGRARINVTERYRWLQDSRKSRGE